MNKKGIRNAAIQSLLAIPGEWGWRSGLTSESQGARCPDLVQLRGRSRRGVGGGGGVCGEDEEEELG